MQNAFSANFFPQSTSSFFLNYTLSVKLLNFAPIEQRLDDVSFCFIIQWIKTSK